jgi:peptide deformylase
MALREIIILPDKQLRLVSKPIEKVTPEIRKLADDMFETMYDAPGIGLAAIQVAQPLRLITMDLAKPDQDGETKPEPRVFINPEIIASSEDLSVYEEGCLSIPEYYEEVERPAKVRVRYIDLDGKVHEEDAEGLYATCIQHEIDHLNGVLFVDYLSKLKRDQARGVSKVSAASYSPALPPPLWGRGVAQAEVSPSSESGVYRETSSRESASCGTPLPNPPPQGGRERTESFTCPSA